LEDFFSKVGKVTRCKGSLEFGFSGRFTWLSK
jgi:hypothetical protein